ncbi:hypothetical protein [Longimicrobium terrae]|uniref:Uncharacterized protein n=1 Tax=Longimicrobium terrae TaxID=1639882 RepID=A0A841GYQ1_9BACT|nr:hypothetical protein [Longimicrobium terrae]MBB4636599.1 hypothetical protein [Longimicrobium terrae]MBB6070877.1 hypothetical protein [Longimicrobium terrae]NNC28901.1 hypothetical protein [Longimicrobium terrae]
MLDEAQELALIRSVLLETFPEQSRRVGKTNLNDIVERRGQVRIVPISGDRLDWTEALILLANGAVLLSQWAALRGRADWHIHIARVEHVRQSVQIGTVNGGGEVNVTGIDFQVPPDIAGKLDPATINRLISSFLAHMDATDAQESDSGSHA